MGDLWQAIIGQDAVVQLLRRAVERGEVPHAWLFVGPSGAGQEQAVRALAADLNCPEPGPEGHACGRCSSCERTRRGVHPEYREFVPEGAHHLVHAVRNEWWPAATRSTFEGRRKVLRIVAADRMNEAAQNAFLKLLEEPPPPVVWVLEAEDADALLDTIVSRCRRVAFQALTPGALADHPAVRQIPPGERADRVRAAMGSPERLADLADPDAAEARRRHLALIDRLMAQGPAAAVPAARDVAAWAASRTSERRRRNGEELARLEESFGGEWPTGLRTRLAKRFQRLEREERHRALRAFLDDLGFYLRDLVAVVAGGDPEVAINRDHAEALRRDAARIPLTLAVEGLQAVADTADALDRQGQPELHLERLLLRLAVGLSRQA